jgi:long-subunit fatty acid transport protein
MSLSGAVMKYLLCLIPFLIATLVCSIEELQSATLFQEVGIASSPNPVGSGARAIGMGGAFIAIADDSTAASWNPSGLIQLERPEASIVGEYFHRRTKFSSDERPEIDNTSNVDDVNLNYLSVSYPFFFYRNIVVSLNYQRLFDFKREFEHQFDFSSGNLDVIQNKKFKQDGYLAAAGLAGAIELTPKLSVGATLNIWTDELWWDNAWDEKYNETAVGTLSGVPVTVNTIISDEYSKFRGINANIGLLWNLNKYFTIGAVVKTPFEASVRHEFNFEQIQEFGPPFNDTIISQRRIEENVDLDIPLSFGAGIAVRFSDAFTMSADVYRTDWSNYILEDSQGNKFSPITGRPKSESNVKDTTQIRIGAEYLFISQSNEIVVPVRAGVFYDPEPAEGNPEDFYGIAVGSGIGYKKLMFDAAYQLRWGNNVDTNNLIPTSEADIYQHTFLASVIIHF